MSPKKDFAPQRDGYIEPPLLDLGPVRQPLNGTTDTMTGKKIVCQERPDDEARHLASLLTLEDQVSLKQMTPLSISALIISDIAARWRRFLENGSNTPKGYSVGKDF